jgi:exodeoxyribonuclease V
MWSPQQERALRAIRRWLKESDQQVFRLFGYAGTGKTEIAREIGRNVPSARFAAFTGKAAQVLRQKGCDPVSTIHRLIYHSEFDEEKGTFVHKRKPIADDVRLIIVDEASMVDRELARDLLALRRKLLIIADPGQLPPPNGRAGFFMDDDPDAMLTEIHRQAEHSPIIRLADTIRRGGNLPRVGYRAGNELRICDREEFGQHDVVLVGTNDMRRIRNSRLRAHFGYARLCESRVPPKKGECVVCRPLGRGPIANKGAEHDQMASAAADRRV